MMRSLRCATAAFALAFLALPVRSGAAEPLGVPEPTPYKANAGRSPTIPVLEFTSTDIRSVFRLLSEYAAVDIVVDPQVTGSVNAVVTNKTWQEVVHIVSKMMNLTVTNELGFLYVQRTEDYQKKLLDKAAASVAQDAAMRLQRKIIRISNAKADEIATAIKDLSSPRGKITVVTRTNSLIVLDGPEQIAAIEKVIRQLDLETSQIMIEARLLQVSSNAQQDLGINWQLASGPGVGWATAPKGLGNGNGNLGTGPFAGGQIINNTPTASPSQTVAFGLLNGNLGVVISSLLKSGKGELLSSPQITTQDNKEAKIFMGQQVPIQTKDQAGNTITTFVEAGTELVVLPQITAPDRIALLLKPQRNSYEVDPKAGVVIQKQSAETNVTVSDGETVVIAGLVSRDEQESETGVPLLKDIPFLGALFKYKQKILTKKDLIIFVTPRIVHRDLSLTGPKVEESVEPRRDLDAAATAPSVEPPVENAP